MADTINESIKGKAISRLLQDDKTYNRNVRSKMSINDIRALAWNASQGDTVAYEKLQAENSKLATIANRRLRALKKAHLDMFSYDRAITYLSNNDISKFSKEFANPSDFKGMVEQMSELVSFVNSKTSTVTGARKYLDEKLQKISDFTGHTYSKEQKKALGRLLGTDSVSALLRDVRGDSGEVIEALEEIAMADVDVQELTSTIDKYLTPYIPWSNAPWSTKSETMNYDEMMKALKELYED